MSFLIGYVEAGEIAQKMRVFISLQQQHVTPPENASSPPRHRPLRADTHSHMYTHK